MSRGDFKTISGFLPNVGPGDRPFFVGGLGLDARGAVEGDAGVTVFVAGAVGLFAPGTGTERRVIEIVWLFVLLVIAKGD